MAKQSTEPLARLLERYGDPKKVAEDGKAARTLAKSKLVAELVGLLEPREGESKDGLRARLTKVSNAKLLTLRERTARTAPAGRRGRGRPRTSS
jgi:hypothetical protein